MIKEETRFVNSLIFEGMVSISAIIEAINKNITDRKILKVYFDNSKIESNSKQLYFLKKSSEKLGFSIEFVSAEFINSKTVGNTHGGIIAECSDRSISDISDLEIKSNGFYVMIEGIEDPYNFGYALRSIYAAGADAVILSPRNWMSAAGVVARSSAGASELIPIYIGNPIDTIKIMKSKGIKVVSAGIRNSQSIYEADLSKPLFLIVGGEKRGISSEVLNSSDAIVRIDYGREFKNSLSAASAATIITYEVYRQNR